LQGAANLREASEFRPFLTDAQQPASAADAEAEETQLAPSPYYEPTVEEIDNDDIEAWS
jgi:hypothetical protein